jgi:hypothetical protein
MKVRCTAEGEWSFKKTVKKKVLGFISTGVKEVKYVAKGPKLGEIVTVSSSFWSDGQEYYRLVEWPRYDNGGYNSKHFEPLEENMEEVSYEEIKKKHKVSAN